MTRGLNFTIAINYGSRDEMRRAMVRMAGDVELGKVASADITEELFNSYLDTGIFRIRIYSFVPAVNSVVKLFALAACLYGIFI